MANAWIIKPLPMALTATAVASGFSAEYAGNDYLGVVWKSTPGAQTRSLMADLGADKPIDTILVLGCDGAAPGNTIQIAANTDAFGSSFTAPEWVGAALPLLAGTELPTSGRGIGMWQAPTSSPPAASRYWQIRMGSLALQAATVGRLVIGKRIQPARNFSNGLSFGVRELGGVDFGRYGNLLRRRGTKLRLLGLTFQSLYKDEVEAAIAPLLEQIGGTEPIAIVTDPDAHAMRQRRIYFGPLVGELGVVQRKAQFWQSQLQMVSLI